MTDPIEQQSLNEKLTACISLALDLDNLFKLYSYRCISPEQFVEFAAEKVKTYNSALNKKGKNELSKV